MFVALAAVGLTTFLTLGALGTARRQFFEPGAGTHAPWQRGAPAPPFSDADAVALRNAFGNVSRTAFLAALLSFVLASVAALLMTRRLTRPLLKLVDGAERLAAGERGVRISVPPGQDELRLLTETFNRLGEGLERQEAWRKDMVADIAHDLRTPLAVLRSEVEAMQDGLRDADTDGLARLHREVMLLARLVDDLRDLASLESDAVSLQLQPVDLRELLRQAHDAFSGRAEAMGTRLELELPAEPMLANVDPGRILQVLGNLLDNALRYAGGAAVEVTLSGGAEESGVRVSVADRGPGLGRSDPEQLFERFYRGDAARGRPREEAREDAREEAREEARDEAREEVREVAGGGSGLGLAIARALVEAHGGTIRAEDRSGGGLRLTLWLPTGVTRLRST